MKLDELLNQKMENLNLEDKNKKRKKRNIITIVVAISLAVVSFVSCGLIKKKKNDQKNTSNNSVLSIEVSKDELGDSYTSSIFEDNTYEYENGKVYKDKETYEKSKDVGTKIDDKNGTLIYDENSNTVKEKEKHYEIKDNKTGEIIDSGIIEDKNVIGDYVKDTTTSDYVKKEEQGKYIYSDGGLISIEDKDKEETEQVIKIETTITPNDSDDSYNKETEIIEIDKTTTDKNGGLVEENYYIVGNFKFKTKDDYEDWKNNGYYGYALVNGVMEKITDEIASAPTLEQIQKEKILVKK